MSDMPWKIRQLGGNGTDLAHCKNLVWSNTILQMVSQPANADLEDGLNGGEIVEEETCDHEPIIQRERRILQASGPEACSDTQRCQDHEDNADGYDGARSFGGVGIEGCTHGCDRRETDFVPTREMVLQDVQVTTD